MKVKVTVSKMIQKLKDSAERSMIIKVKVSHPAIFFTKYRNE